MDRRHMQTQALITKHDAQIDSIKLSIAELTTKMTVMLTDHHHLSQKVEEILQAVKSFKDTDYQIKTFENEMVKLNSRVILLEEQAKVPVSKRFWTALKEWWFFWTPALFLLGWIGDLLYRFPHK